MLHNIPRQILFESFARPNLDQKRILKEIRQMLPVVNMPFPKSEWDSLKKRLKKRLPIYTTRIQKEQDKYKKGMKVTVSFWPKPLTIKEVKTYTYIDDHPFYDHLTQDQIKQIKGKTYDIVKLEQI